MNWFKKIFSFIKKSPIVIPTIAVPTVYVAFEMDRPFLGIYLTAPKEGFYVAIKNLTLNEAAQLIPGKGFKWAYLPLNIRAAIEAHGSIEIEFSDLVKWIR